MKDVKSDETKNQDFHGAVEFSEKNKKSYIPPVCETHNPLKIMSKYEDKSSELPF